MSEPSKPCKFYLEGKCTRGASCKFAHVKVCSFFSKGICALGTDCPDAHVTGGGEPAPSGGAGGARAPCRLFQTGQCLKGSNCADAHITAAEPAPAAEKAPCRFFPQCSKGANCQFSHTIGAGGPPTGVAPAAAPNPAGDDPPPQEKPLQPEERDELNRMFGAAKARPLAEDDPHWQEFVLWELIRLVPEGNPLSELGVLTSPAHELLTQQLVSISGIEKVRAIASLSVKLLLEIAKYPEAECRILRLFDAHGEVLFFWFCHVTDQEDQVNLVSLVLKLGADSRNKFSADTVWRRIRRPLAGETRLSQSQWLLNFECDQQCLIETDQFPLLMKFKNDFPTVEQPTPDTQERFMRMGQLAKLLSHTNKKQADQDSVALICRLGGCKEWSNHLCEQVDILVEKEQGFTSNPEFTSVVTRCFLQHTAVFLELRADGLKDIPWPLTMQMLVEQLSRLDDDTFRKLPDRKNLQIDCSAAGQGMRGAGQSCLEVARALTTLSNRI